MNILDNYNHTIHSNLVTQIENNRVSNGRNEDLRLQEAIENKNIFRLERREVAERLTHNYSIATTEYAHWTIAQELIFKLSIDDINDIADPELRVHLHKARESFINIVFDFFSSKGCIAPNSHKVERHNSINNSAGDMLWHAAVTADRLRDPLACASASLTNHDLSGGSDIVNTLDAKGVDQILGLSLGVVFNLIAITVTAADLVSFIEKKSKLIAINKELKNISKKLNSPGLTVVCQKELIIQLVALRNVKKILKGKIDARIVDSLLQGMYSVSAFTNSLMSIAVPAIAATAAIALAPIAGGCMIAQGVKGLIKNFEMYEELNGALHRYRDVAEFKCISNSTSDPIVEDAFNSIIDLKLDNLKHFQKAELVYDVAQNSLLVVAGAGVAVSPADPTGSCMIVAGVATGVKTVLFLGRGAYLHRSDIQTLVKGKTPVGIQRFNTQRKIAATEHKIAKTFEVLKSELKYKNYQTKTIQRLFSKTINVGKLKKSWKRLNYEFQAELMEDRTSSKRRNIARQLAGLVKSMNESQFKQLKIKLIDVGIIETNHLNSNRYDLITFITRFIRRM